VDIFEVGCVSLAITAEKQADSGCGESDERKANDQSWFI
jgi:hypothetical protein